MMCRNDATPTKTPDCAMADATTLADLLRTSRTRTLALMDCFDAALGAELRVPLHPQFNPPLWELGHVGWFQGYWIRRNIQRWTPPVHNCMPAQRKQAHFHW